VAFALFESGVALGDQTGSSGARSPEGSTRGLRLIRPDNVVSEKTGVSERCERKKRSLEDASTSKGGKGKGRTSAGHCPIDGVVPAI
jgi:hypothetical protein